MFTKQNLKKYTMILTAGSMQIAAATAADTTKKTNILFIPVDDLKPILGCYGNNQIKTPNIDRLAKEGMLFFNAHCQQAVCGPSRASVMSGLYPDSTKVWDLKTRMRDINPDILTLPQYFKENGYITTGLGKTYDPRCVGPKLDAPSWSIPYYELKADDYNKLSGPPATWFQDPETKKRLKKATSIIKEKHLKGKEASNIYRELNAKPTTECLDLPDDAYPDGAMAKKACEILAKFAKEGKPFFLSTGFKKPHLPFAAPKKYWDMYDRDKIKLAQFRKHAKNSQAFTYQDSWELRSCYTDVPSKGPISDEKQRELIHGYMASVSFVDAQIGKVLDKLDELGLADNTVICLWGDHGWHLGDHGMWCKHTNLEQATRAPLIFAGKGIPKNETSSAPVAFVDIFPTLCDLAKLKIPKVLQGKSLTPIFKNPKASIHQAVMSQFDRWHKDGPVMGYALRDGRYRYIEWVQKNFRKGETSGPVVFREVYDYKTDPLETINQAGNPEYQDVVERMSKILRETYKIKIKQK
jgi:arylsulfatase A-like enzyme